MNIFFTKVSWIQKKTISSEHVYGIGGEAEATEMYTIIIDSLAMGRKGRVSLSFPPSTLVYDMVEMKIEINGKLSVMFAHY